MKMLLDTQALILAGRDQLPAIPGILGNSMQEPMLRDRDDLRFVV
jgi:hypothetical protein